MLINTQTKTKNILNKKGIFTYKDILDLLPKKYKDYRYIYEELSTDQADSYGCFIGYLTAVNKKFDKGHSIITCRVKVKDRQMSITFIGMNYLEKSLNRFQGEKIAIFGKLQYSEEYNWFSILSPDRIIPLDEDYKEYCKIEPVYKKFSGISEKTMKSIRKDAIDSLDTDKVNEIPEDLARKHLGFTPLQLKEAYKRVHFPQNTKDIEDASRAILINNFWEYASELEHRISLQTESTFVKFKTHSKFDILKSSLPYTLTADQAKYINKMANDIAKGQRVSALLQGDVGCGKTMVAILMLILMAENGHQGALLAPTDILASQHYEEIKGYCEKLGFTCAYFAGKTTAKEKKNILKGLEDGSIDIVIGTHALCSEKINYKSLGMVIIDEEHRFGVEQKEIIANKASEGINVLYMSATPIPRTMAGAMYGTGMEIMDIHTMPAGRSPIQTAACVNDKTVFSFLEKQLSEGRQAYVVCPLIENDEEDENNRMAGVRSAEDTFKVYSDYFNGRYSVGIVNGKMNKEEISDTLSKFRNNEIQILVSTTVVEVGVNVPNASVMVISNAERYGLATMHQLRGRVGRGAYKGYCILQTEETDNERIQTMCKYQNGFDIAEKDMAIRGTGNLIGTEQSGYTVIMKLILENQDLYSRVHNAAREYAHR